ncbi:MAG TPA: dTDP-4-dehydrorhamnose 3,5-epimerase family protein [Verrucomicrobiae bacterium]|jgi:dTDP-4-dehydrorhamnose 3,5-epimerase|nr:dTDP-4-dehydrorhamnose 3,5-epimerase family protein [Verrucomicrobiae bacterium]
MIHDVLVTPLRQIPDDRGKVMHMLKRTDAAFREFGEIYFSLVNPGAIKAWKKHLRMTLNLAVIHGSARLVIYDDRAGSPTHGRFQENILGPDHYHLVTVPPGLWTGFIGLSTSPALLCNCASLPHDPTEVERKTADDQSIPYSWKM